MSLGIFLVFYSLFSCLETPPMPVWPELSRALTKISMRLSQGIKNFYGGSLDLFFPLFCRECGEALNPAGSEVLCERCYSTITWIGNACFKCGRPVLNPGEESDCEGCRRQHLAFDRVIAAGIYEGPLRRLILLLKYQGDLGVLDFLASILNQSWQDRLRPILVKEGLDLSGPDVCVVPIPTHWLKKWMRGRDPIGILTHEFVLKTELRLCPLIKRKHWTRAQTGLPRKIRIRNQINAFQTRKGMRVPTTVIILDDVVTTCSTTSEAARVLRQAGVINIYVLAIGRS